MKPPILVISDDVDLFESVEEAEGYLEAPDVPNLRAWDSEGYPIRPVVVRFLLATNVKLEGDPTATPDIASLRAGLVRLISRRERIGQHPLELLSLDELLRRSLTHRNP